MFTNHVYIYYTCIKRIWHWITYNGWYAIKPNQTKSRKIVFPWLLVWLWTLWSCMNWESFLFLFFCSFFDRIWPIFGSHFWNIFIYVCSICLTCLYEVILSLLSIDSKLVYQWIYVNTNIGTNTSNISHNR